MDEYPGFRLRQRAHGAWGNRRWFLEPPAQAQEGSSLVFLLSAVGAACFQVVVLFEATLAMVVAQAGLFVSVVR